MALAVKTKAAEAAGVSPNSSALLGATLLANREEAMAAVQTAILLARNFKSSLYLDLPEKSVVPIDFTGEQNSVLPPDLLDQVDAKLRELGSSHPAGFVVQFDLTAASFLSAGNISMRIRSTGLERQETPDLQMR